jgi:site-specific recombinase XerC
LTDNQGMRPRYLREERALANATIVNYLPFVGELLTQRFGTSEVQLSELRASDVVGFVQRRVHQLHLKRAKLMATALRSFLQYARYRGDLTLDLAAAIPPVANWSMTSIPRAIADDQVYGLLASVDRSTAMGRRDYAILLLLARLGLRSSEVAFLELDDMIGQRARSACARRAGGASRYPYRPMSVRRSSPISSRGDHTAAAGAYFCATRPRCAVS